MQLSCGLPLIHRIATRVVIKGVAEITRVPSIGRNLRQPDRWNIVCFSSYRLLIGEQARSPLAPWAPSPNRCLGDLGRLPELDILHPHASGTISENLMGNLTSRLKTRENLDHGKHGTPRRPRSQTAHQATDSHITGIPE